MIQLVRHYTHWLHTRWPAGTVEKLPVSDANGLTSVPGVRIVGDLTGIPLLKFSSHTGARAVRAILQEPDFQSGKLSDPQVLDRKSTRLNSSHGYISYAVFCLKKKKTVKTPETSIINC